MKAYLIRLTASAMLASMIRRIAPTDGAGKAARLAAGILILLTAFGPFAQIDTLSGAMHLARKGFGDVLSAEDFTVEKNAMLAEFISQEAESYILDKAGDAGTRLEVHVKTAVKDGYPVPWSVTIRGRYTETLKNSLSRMMEEDLDIPEERQEWWSM